MKALFRLCVSVPIVMFALIVANVTLDRHLAWPSEAIAYQAWYATAMASQHGELLNLIGLVSILGIVISSLGVILFWSPARYSYAFFTLSAISSDVPFVPILVAMPEVLLDNIATIFLGVTLGLMFTTPCSAWFKSPNTSAAP